MNRLSKREREKLHSFWGQLIDLKCGQIVGLEIKNDDCAELLSQVIKERLQEENELDEAIAIEDRAESVGDENYPIGGMIEPYDIEREKEELIQSPKDEPKSDE
jgi:hypothetical protein